MNTHELQRDFSNDYLDLSVVDYMHNEKNKNLSISPSTRNNYLVAGKQFNEFLSENDLQMDSDSIKAFLNPERWKPGTLNLKRQALVNIIQNQKNITGNFLKIAAVKELFKKDVKRIKTSKAITRDQYLTRDQIEKLKCVANSKLSLIIEFLFQTGCRVSELVNIKLEDMKFNGVVKIKIVGKGAKERVVYAKPELIEQIRNVFKGQFYLFETKTGFKYNRKNLLRDFKKIGSKAGFDISPHTLRHSLAMFLKEMGKSAQYIQKYLGHSSVATTLEYYFHENPGDEILEVF